MKTLIFTLLILICVVGSCFANPFVVASPMENNVEYYVIDIDGQDEIIPANWDMMFLYDMGYLDIDKEYACGLKAGNKEGESPPFKFIIERRSNKNWIFFDIKKIPEEALDDPYYNDRFVDEDLSIKIKVSNVVVTDANVTDNNSNSSSGGGCFISVTR